MLGAIFQDIIYYTISKNTIEVTLRALVCFVLLQVRVKSADMKCAVDLLMNNESWPRGLFVKRFFKPKEDGHAQQ